MFGRARVNANNIRHHKTVRKSLLPFPVALSRVDKNLTQAGLSVSLNVPWLSSLSVIENEFN
jgi:hypothetical protein